MTGAGLAAKAVATNRETAAPSIGRDRRAIIERRSDEDRTEDFIGRLQ